jgi:hypothetical protein
LRESGTTIFVFAPVLLCHLYENGARFISNSYVLESRFSLAKTKTKTGFAVIIRRLRQRYFTHAPLSAWKHRTMTWQQQTQQRSDKLRVLPEQIPQLPPRPDRLALSDSIPLFFVGRSQSGFWVARESEGLSGGLFLLRRPAARFARNKSSPGACATMFVERLELDGPNQGSRVAELIAGAIAVTKQRLPLLANFIAVAAAEWRKLISQIFCTLAGQRRNRDAIAREPSRGESIQILKNDSDLPGPR